MFGRAPERPAPMEPARAPDGWCIYCIGDIHGELALLKRLLGLIDEDAAGLRCSENLRPMIVFLGDYVDRGPDSRGVLTLLTEMRDRAGNGQGPACRFLKGNHEEALLAFLQDPVKTADWLHFGGVETLASYGVRVSAGVFDPARGRAIAEAFAQQLGPLHKGFLTELEPIAEMGDYAFVHAGIRPGTPLDKQKVEDLYWIREPFLSSRKFHGKVIVHGHTITDQVTSLDNRIAVDTGAYATGRLSAVVLHGTHRRILQTPPWGSLP